MDSTREDENFDREGDWNAPPGTPPTPPMPRPHRWWFPLAAAIVVLTLAGGVGGYAIARTREPGSTSASTASAASATPSTPSTSSSSSSAASKRKAKLTLAQIEAAVDPAIVDVTATLGSSGTAKGTGMVISSTGEVLTNNHVISGATSVSVQIGGAGTAYQATIVGYDVTDDIAVLQISGVSGLATIQTASASTVSAGDAIVAIGNALGQGGTPAAAQGLVTAVDQTITASDGLGTNAETLSGLIEISAAVEPGDSGGATVNTYGQVVGMTTAASSGGFRPMSTNATTTAYAIPIETARSIARQIEAGVPSATVHIGLHGLLGVRVQDGFGAGAQVVAVQSNSAAAAAGLAAGDVIVSINGTSISSSSALTDALSATHVGDKITVGWQDIGGQAHGANVTLATGAA